MKNLKSLLLIGGMLFCYSVSAQDVDARSPRPNAGSVQQRKADKKKAEQQKKYEKSVAQAKKQHAKNQTKNTRKMMKKSKHTSKQWNDNARDPFFKRLFRKKK
jgi:hypothetical protein